MRQQATLGYASAFFASGVMLADLSYRHYGDEMAIVVRLTALLLGMLSVRVAFLAGRDRNGETARQK